MCDNVLHVVNVWHVVSVIYLWINEIDYLISGQEIWKSLFISGFQSLSIIKLKLRFSLKAYWISYFRSIHQRCSVKKRIPRNFTKFTAKHLCQGLFFNKVSDRPATLLKETLAQVFTCEFCDISKNTFLHKTPLVDTSVIFTS